MNETVTTNMIVMLQPEWLWLLPILLLATILLRLTGHHSKAAGIACGDASTEKRFRHPLVTLIASNTRTSQTPTIQTILFGLAITGLVTCLTEPVRIGEKLPDPPQQRDIVFIVDTSITMTLRDYVLNGNRVDRMTMLKGVLDRFIQKLPGERISIVIFGDAAYTLAPLTRDHDLLRRMLSRIQATMVGRYNNMGEAIALAVKQAEKQKEGQRRRILVMLTDADKPTGSIPPETAAELARQAKLPLYTIAIGATTLAAEEVRASGLIYEPVDITLLKHIAEQTGARNYQAGDVNALEQAVTDIAKHETSKRAQAPHYQQQPLYLWPLLFSLALLITAALLPTLSTLLLKPDYRQPKTLDNR